MALIKCTECGQMVSDKAANCPNCGCPVEREVICEECGEHRRLAVSHPSPYHACCSRCHDGECRTHSDGRQHAVQVLRETAHDAGRRREAHCHCDSLYDVPSGV